MKGEKCQYTSFTLSQNYSQAGFNKELLFSEMLMLPLKKLKSQLMIFCIGCQAPGKRISK